MIQLTANLSTGLLELIRSESVQIDAVEVGPWFSAEQIKYYRQQLPGWRFYLHYGNLVSRMRWIPGTADLLNTYLQDTQSPWLSFHYSLLPPGYVWFAAKFGRYLPLPNSARASEWFVDGVKKLKCLKLPLLLENMPSFPTSRYALETSAERISESLALTETDFLLDIAHARVAASVLGLDVYDYIASLPLERVKQIHTSGPRARDGRLYDAHEDLQEEDYRLLAWVLARIKPEMVTLEFIKDRELLCRQLKRIKEIITAA